MVLVVKVNLLGYKVSLSSHSKDKWPKKLRSCTVFTLFFPLQIVEEHYLCNEDCKQVEKSINEVSIAKCLQSATQCLKNIIKCLIWIFTLKLILLNLNFRAKNGTTSRFYWPYMTCSRSFWKRSRSDLFFQKGSRSRSF